MKPAGYEKTETKKLILRYIANYNTITSAQKEEMKCIKPIKEIPGITNKLKTAVKKFGVHVLIKPPTPLFQQI